MRDFKNLIRISAGNIQEQYRPNEILQWLTRWDLKRFLKQAAELQLRVWTRNSTEYDAHVPLLSDFDITLFDGTLEQVQHLEKLRKKFFFIGEIGYYHHQIRDSLLAVINPFELARDPQLMHKLGRSAQGSSAQKITFLARHLQGDYKWLCSLPEVRIKKWNYLLFILGEKPLLLPQVIKIFELIKNPDQRKDCEAFFQLPAEKEILYQASVKAHWKYLFPHCHIWHLEKTETQHYLRSLSELEKEILIEQLKWEFWGIGCHHHMVETKGSVSYLKNLKAVVRTLSPQDPALAAMENIISFLSDLD